MGPVYASIKMVFIMKNILYLCLSMLFLAACNTSHSGSPANPSYMPTGYTYHRNVYKAPPGPEFASASDEDAAANNDEDEYRFND